MGKGLANRTRRTFVLTAVVALAATLIGAAPAAAQADAFRRGARLESVRFGRADKRD